MAASGPLAAAVQVPKVDAAILKRHDEHTARLLERQATDAAQRSCGSMPDDYGLYSPGAAGGILNSFTTAYLHPDSKFHQNNLLVERMRLAARYLEREQSPDGNIDLLSTNFNSPPDTGFVVWQVAQAALVALRYGHSELAAIMEPFLKKAAAGMAKGGVHTPNHRWVIASALAQVHALWPSPTYTKRIEQWLAEGIDIDADGQYTERSTLVYNTVCNRAFILLAAKLNRPELLEPVRRNLNAMLYLLHPGNEIVTEISRRQDLNQRGTIGVYWLPLAFLAARDGNGAFAALAREFAASHASLGDIMDLPELSQTLPASAALPENYEKLFPAIQVARIRRGRTSATMLLGGNSYFLTLRRGEAVINAVRFASAFFGKGQFVPKAAGKRDGAYHFSQTLQADYVQPLDPARKVSTGEWGATRAARRKTEICKLVQSATVTETPKGFRVRLQSAGTANVPLSVEISFRDGGKLEGCAPAPKAANAWLLRGGMASYRVGSDVIRFGPGLAGHGYTQVRGAEPKLAGQSVYITGFTPFDHTVEFELG